MTITERAAQAIRDSIVGEKKLVADSYLRVSVGGGGCSGMMYHLSIESELNEGDTVVECDDVRVVIDPKSKLFKQIFSIPFDERLFVD